MLKKVLTKSVGKYTLINQISWSGSYSRLYLLLGPVNDLESCLLKARSDHARSACVRLRFFCCLFREERQRPRVLPEEHRQKERADDQVSKGTIASPHPHEE
jgi:hypothetical protein